jgi:hypothetical protein
MATLAELTACKNALGRGLLACGVAVLLLAAGSGAANAAEDPAARTLFDAGLLLMDQGKPVEACPMFEESLRRQASIGAALNLARCHEALGRLATAWTEYQKAASMARAAGDKEREAAALELAKALEPKVPKLLVQVDKPVPGLKVTRNAEEVDAASTGVPIAVDPGKHRIEATAPGHKAWSVELDVPAASGLRSVAVPALEPSPMASPAPGLGGESAAERGSGDAFRLTGIVLTAAGVVAVGLGAVFGGLAASDASNAEDDLTLCPNERCTPEGRAAIDSAESKATASTALLPIGGALAVAGVVLLVVSATDSGEGTQPATSAPTARLVPALGLGTVGLGIAGTF